MHESTALAERTEMIQSPIYGEIVPIAAIQQTIARVQAAKASVMKKGLHYGVIPGTNKDTLLKPGAELINLMFGVSVDPDPVALREDEGVDDVGLPYYRCTARMVLTTRRTKTFLGASYGYASSLEEKYKWRRASGKKEFDATPEGRKRVKFRRKNNGEEWEELQVRTEVEDIKNTVLQIAMKRAEVSGTKRAHALSDMFGQDLEDLPAEIRESIIDGEVVADDDRKPVQAGQRKSEQAPASNSAAPTAGAAKSEPASDKKQIGKIRDLDEKQGTKSPYWFITLNTGFKCATWSSTLAQQAREHQAAGDVVDLVVEPAKDPKYAPGLKEIRIVSGPPQGA